MKRSLELVRLGLLICLAPGGLARGQVAINVSPSLPSDIAGGASAATLQQAAAFAWQEFIGLNWPAMAGQRDVADQNQKFGAGAGPLVWQTFRSKVEIFNVTKDGVPPGYSATAPDHERRRLPIGRASLGIIPGVYVWSWGSGVHADTLRIDTIAGSGSGPSPVPEPSTWAMMLVGFAGLGYAAEERRSISFLMGDQPPKEIAPNAVRFAWRAWRDGPKAIGGYTHDSATDLPGVDCSRSSGRDRRAEGGGDICGDV